MTSNRKKFIDLILQCKTLVIKQTTSRNDEEAGKLQKQINKNTNELIRLYDLNTKELNQEEINRLATAYKCPNCSCSNCLNTAEEGKERGSND